jgi:hypothetical protein
MTLLLILVSYDVHVLIDNKVKKVKLSLCFNWAPCHEDVLRSEGIAPRIIDLGTRWR